MPIELEGAQDTSAIERAAVQDHLRRIEQAVEQLNSRIVRLAIALGIDLSDKHSLEQVLKEPAAGIALESRSGDHLHNSQQRRIAMETAELRGLLVLRYGIEQRLSQEMGYSGLQEILQHVEKHMESEGFARGADGLDVPGGAVA